MATTPHKPEGVSFLYTSHRCKAIAGWYRPEFLALSCFVPMPERVWVGFMACPPFEPGTLSCCSLFPRPLGPGLTE